MAGFRSTLVVGILLALGACSSNANQDDTSLGSLGGTYTGNVGGVAAAQNGGNGDGNQAGVGNGNQAAGGSGTSSSGTKAGAGNVGGSGQATAGGDTGGNTECQPQISHTQSSPPIIEFQLDITSSMTETNFASTNGRSKWAAEQQALQSALSSLATAHPDWMVGVSYFAKPIGNSCYNPSQAVPIAPLSQNLSALNGSIQNTTPNGYTPTYTAWSFAFDTITTFGLNYPGSNEYIVLMTDGVPTVEDNGCTVGPGNNGACPSGCISSADFTREIGLIEGLGVPNHVKTFFVAIPGAEDPQGADFDPLYMLSQAAVVGGTAPAGCTPVAGVLQTNCNNPNGGTTCLASRGTYCCIDLTTSANFTAALEDAIASNIATNVKPSCVFSVPQSSGATYVDIQHTLVEYLASAGAAPQQLRPATTSDCADGDFYYNDPTNVTQLTLCQQMCATLQSNPAGQVSVTFECTIIG